MGHSYSNVLVHIVFSTKNRAKIIPRERQEDLWRYMIGIAKNIKVNVLAIGGMPDHIHTLVALPGTLGHSTLIQKMKENSSKWMGPKFEWQEGFGAFSVSDSRREDVIAPGSPTSAGVAVVGVELHPQSGRASQETQFRRGIHCAVEGA